jgi:hypothetical protein
MNTTIKTQKELKALHNHILETEAWPGSPKMVDFCAKQVAHIVELTTGDIIIIEKPAIKKDFCFGYRLSRYDTEEYDQANDAAEHAASDSDYFMEQNLAQIDELLDILTGKNDRQQVHVSTKYYSCPDDSKLKALQFFYWHDCRCEKYPKLEGEDLRRVIEGYQIVREAFVKRLKNYLKRYGMTQVRTWSYWVDE